MQLTNKYRYSLILGLIGSRIDAVKGEIILGTKEISAYAGPEMTALEKARRSLAGSVVGNRITNEAMQHWYRQINRDKNSLHTILAASPRLDYELYGQYKAYQFITDLYEAISW